MAPNLLDKSSGYYLAETNSAEPVQIIGKQAVHQDIQRPQQVRPKTSHPKYTWQIVWRNVFIFIYLHIAAIYGMYLVFTVAQWRTNVWVITVALVGAMGVTGGAHRLWAHRTYKAKLPLRIWLAFWQTVSLQNHIYEWVRDHRVHHKFTETDADPHNARRGFFFSHMGWLLVKKHKDVMSKGKTVDMSDLEADPVVMFQKRYYEVLAGLLCFVLPTIIPYYVWNENLITSFHVVMFRYVLSLHITWLVNSAAHMYGFRPYEKNILATDSKTVGILAVGEGWHNYHHVFPWDYKAAELGNYRMNFTTGFLDLMCKIGQAYDLKTVSVELINKRAKRTGDGTRKVDVSDVILDEINNHDDKDNIWGWGDSDMKSSHRELVHVFNPEPKTG